MEFTFLNREVLDNGRIFIMMVGPPGSGKTTIVDKLVELYDFVKISPDEIREEITGDPFDQTRNDEVFAKVYSRINMFLSSGYNVVYDATNCRTNYRFKILDISNKIAKKTYCICATTPLSVCFERNNDRGQQHIPEDVIEKMYFNLKKHPPTVFEGYDAIFKF